jgi:hypothetical protein
LSSKQRAATRRKESGLQVPEITIPGVEDARADNHSGKQVLSVYLVYLSNKLFNTILNEY